MCIEELIIYGKKYIHSDKVKTLLSNVLGYDTLELLNHLDEKVSIEKEIKYKSLIEGVLNNKPIQYLLGNVNFYGNEFLINENVLIPRFETEELVENTINFINAFFCGTGKVIDLGTGSGVIGITLKKKIPKLDVICLDISDDALKIAKINAQKNNVNVKFLQGDMLENFSEKVDVIISNPPYISKNEKIDDIVKENEPHIALFAENNGLYFYEKILYRAKNIVNDKYLIAFEIGATQKNKVIELAKKYMLYSNIKCLKDLSGRDRMIFIYNV